MLHCEVLQLPCTFNWLWIWLVWHGRDWSVCVCFEVGKIVGSLRYYYDCDLIGRASYSVLNSSRCIYTLFVLSGSDY